MTFSTIFPYTATMNVSPVFHPFRPPFRVLQEPPRPPFRPRFGIAPAPLPV